MIARRDFILAAGAGLAVPAALSQGTTSWPERPVRMISPFPGGASDALTRVLADQLQLQLKQPFVVDSKSGAGGTSAWKRRRMRLQTDTRPCRPPSARSRSTRSSTRRCATTRSRTSRSPPCIGRTASLHVPFRGAAQSIPALIGYMGLIQSGKVKLFLASPEAVRITGQAISVNGGISAA